MRSEGLFRSTIAFHDDDDDDENNVLVIDHFTRVVAVSMYESSLTDRHREYGDKALDGFFQKG